MLRYNLLIMSYKIDKGLIKCNYKFNTTANHNYPTRNNDRIRLPVFRTITGKNSIFRQCAEAYRDIDTKLKTTRTLSAFKNKLKTKILHG